ncbi:Uncharacterised protein [Anaerococcus octavius]|uniref:Uncharacterized protein n=1 Tax=Anaerococcus octavius TaxID=54007 RepID=A0A380WT58_9FIRM|nr:hypothetical protein [Anaerococcus octavius]SUU92201.1 Uncharacterised protein [Anaerococcus octavius]
MAKRVKQGGEPSLYKKTRVAESPDAFYDKNPSWNLHKCDKSGGSWCVNHSVLNDDIYKKLSDFERMTWKEIVKQTGGPKKGTNNHFIGFKDLDKKAQNRLIKLNLVNLSDNLFSLRLNGRTRLFGFLDESGIFSILWLDKNHEVCPSIKKNT